MELFGSTLMGFFSFSHLLLSIAQSSENTVCIENALQPLLNSYNYEFHSYSSFPSAPHVNGTIYYNKMNKMFICPTIHEDNQDLEFHYYYLYTMGTDELCSSIDDHYGFCAIKILPSLEPCMSLLKTYFV